MGAAKRRQAAIGKVIEGEARYGGRLREYLGGLGFDRPSPVPCGTCRQCCYHHCIDVDPANEKAEDLAHLDLVPHPTASGGFALAKREDGACVHLGQDGCTVYDHRPRACRYYDCRAFAVIGLIDTFDGDRHSPAWVFDRDDVRERVYTLAVRLAAKRHIETTPEWNSNTVLAAAFLGTGATLPAAIKLIARKEHLSLEKERALQTLFQNYLQSQSWYREGQNGR